MNRIILTSMIVLVFSFAAICQEGFEEQYKFAKDLFDEEKYYDAITEFKRLLFFDGSGTYNYGANYLIGSSYRQGAKFSDAIRHFTLAEINADTDEKVYNSKIEIIRANILRRTTGTALGLIDELQTDERFLSRSEELSYWKGWAYIFADDWQNAAQSFNKVDPDHELKLLAEQVQNEHYSVLFAKTISAVIPGAGQFYSGEYISGLLSLGWNLLWGYLTIKSFVDERIFDGIMVGGFLWFRFYNGNLQNAEKFALEKNLEISNEALRYLQNDYIGLKP